MKKHALGSIFLSMIFATTNVFATCYDKGGGTIPCPSLNHFSLASGIGRVGVPFQIVLTGSNAVLWDSHFVVSANGNFICDTSYPIGNTPYWHCAVTFVTPGNYNLTAVGIDTSNPTSAAPISITP
jgi:hypothetical protein